jgi:uncharacterized membrane protein YfcA
MVISAIMAAMALVLPIAFHAVGLGSKFLPMLLPLLLNGFLVPLPWAAATGALVPLLSAVTTGMPPLYPPVAFTMALEGAVLGSVSAALYRGREKRLWWALAIAILLGRATSFACSWAIASALHLPRKLTTIASLLQGLPGVLLQLVVVPLVVRQAARRRSLLFNHGPGSETNLLQ